MDEFITSFDGTKLFYNTETDPANKAVVVIVHGLCEHQGRYDYVAKRFHEAGYGTYRFDHRGHGKSEGECAYLADFNDILDDTNVVVERALAENPDKPVFLLGHSMGGFTVALYGVKYADKKLSGIICNGGLTADKAGLLSVVPDDLDDHVQLPNELGNGVCSVDEVREWYAKDPLNRKTFSVGIARALTKGCAWFGQNKARFSFPALITHGEKDGLVSPEDSIAMFKGISSTDKQLKIYGNLYHEVLNEYARDEVIDDYLRWMDRRL